ncbi:carboxypeptidase-like regulatory domain-containing protein [Terrimonas pollutisoli]|uniref:carboxypeptidase-like regulatory domain-containing protein n=1 Tax=Terrimonas pollutisoli TaxID=3034147 RepID=UPI0023EB92EF|nr:carboxypeptidase-like regulatory domain-containing protein [Terrimonas sp. H1YJ31]
MQKLRLILFFLVSLFSTLAYGQFTVVGKIVDAESKEPLNGASVYCQNTTIGTTTNKQGEFSLQLKSGGYELIISYTGYQTKQIRISHADSKIPDIEMAKEEKSLGEVIIKTSNEVKDGWTKYGGFFMDHFIGTTPNAAKTSLLNPEVLKFYLLKKSNKLRVLATEPLQIENKALGYNLRYQLDSFIYNYNNNINSYRGFCLYTEMEGDDSLKKVWTANREKAYAGSKLHFMRSYYDSALLEEGFTIDLLDENDNKKFNRVENIYDSTYYGALDSTMQVEIWFPRKISITYTKMRPEPEYLKQFKLPKNVPVQLSYIDMTDAIAIKENGYYYDQKDWINQGYWSWKNLADQLPYDY